MTEKQFLAQVLELAKLTGWLTYHARPARTAKGWRTPVQGDGAGWPDVVAIKGTRGIAWELKVGKGRVTPAQLAWLDAFELVGFGSISARVLYPADWPWIEKELTR